MLALQFFLGYFFLGTGLCFLHQQLDCPEECECHHFRINWVADCSQSNLTEIPVNGLPIETYILDLSDNQLTQIGPLPEGLKLRVLRLTSNKITELSREVFASLPYLIEFDVSSNEVSHLDVDAFTENQGLINVDLSGNPLEIGSGPLLETRALLKLGLSNCSLGPGATRNGELLSGLPGLTQLDLSGNPLRQLHRGLLQPLERLQILFLNNCELETIEEGALEGLESLKELELRGNGGLRSVSGVAVGSLERVDLRWTGLSSPVGLPSVGRPTALLLAGNRLGPDLSFDPPQSTPLLGSLETLDFSDSGINNLEPALAQLAQATKLKELDLSGNPIPPLQLQSLLQHLTRLRRLSLRNCSLSWVPVAEGLGSLVELRELDLSWNPLGKALGPRPPAALAALTRLDMSHCSLASLPKTAFSAMTALENLALAGNPLTKLESHIFLNLTHLKVLDLSDCGLKRLKSTLFDEDFSYPDLVELRLAGNELEVNDEGSFLPSQMSGLVLLDLGRCGLERVPGESLASFGNLTTLLLGGNRLSGSGPEGLEFLQHLPLLEELDLTSNRFAALDPFELRFSHELKTLRLANNPWACGCHLADLWDWALSLRGDLSILPGSTLSNDESEPRKKKALVCSFVPGESPVVGRKGWSEGGRRLVSWWRYVKASDCESSRSRPRPDPAAALVGPRQTEGEDAEGAPADAWWWIALLVMLGISLAVVSLIRKIL